MMFAAKHFAEFVYCPFDSLCLRRVQLNLLPGTRRKPTTVGTGQALFRATRTVPLLQTAERPGTRRAVRRASVSTTSRIECGPTAMLEAAP